MALLSQEGSVIAFCDDARGGSLDEILQNAFLKVKEKEKEKEKEAKGRGGSKVEMVLESRSIHLPPRRCAPPLLFQEGSCVPSS